MTLASEELLDVPFYLDVHHICGSLKATPMKAEMIKSALIHAGERAPVGGLFV